MPPVPSELHWQRNASQYFYGSGAGNSFPARGWRCRRLDSCWRTVGLDDSSAAVITPDDAARHAWESRRGACCVRIAARPSHERRNLPNCTAARWRRPVRRWRCCRSVRKHRKGDAEVHQGERHGLEHGPSPCAVENRSRDKESLVEVEQCLKSTFCMCDIAPHYLCLELLRSADSCGSRALCRAFSQDAFRPKSGGVRFGRA